MSRLIVQYFSDSSEHKLPTQAYEDAVGYDVFAAETRTILPQHCECISIEIHFAIPEGFFGKLFSRSGLLKDPLISCDGRVIDYDFRGDVEVMLINHSENIFTVRTGDKIAQMVFMKKYNVDFKRVNELYELGRTKCGSSGFGSTSSVIKKVKFEEESELEIKEEKAELFENDMKIIDETVNKEYFFLVQCLNKEIS